LAPILRVKIQGSSVHALQDGQSEVLDRETVLGLSSTSRLSYECRGLEAKKDPGPVLRQVLSA
jgi:hypothetical protein